MATPRSDGRFRAGRMDRQAVLLIRLLWKAGPANGIRLGLLSLLLLAGSPWPVHGATGIELVARPGVASPAYWFVEDARTGRGIKKVSGRWGFAEVPAGVYRITLVLGSPQEFVKWGKVSVDAGAVTRVKVTSGIELSGVPEQPPPKSLFIDPVAGGQRVAQLRGRWGFFPVPPGEYQVTLVIRGQSEFVKWGTVTVTEDGIAPIKATSGIDLVGGLDQEAPKLWLVENEATGRGVGQVSRRWGFIPLPPGRYEVQAQFGNMVRAVKGVAVEADTVTLLPVARFGFVQMLADRNRPMTFDPSTLAAANNLSVFRLKLGDAVVAGDGDSQVTVLDATGRRLLAVIPDPPSNAIWLTPPRPRVFVRHGAINQSFRDIPVGDLVELAIGAGAGEPGALAARPVRVDIVIESPENNAIVTEETVTVIGRASTTTRAGVTQIALIIDTSGSVNDPSGADLDGDGNEETILEAEVAAGHVLLDKLERLEAQSPGTAFAVAILGFADQAEVMAGLTRMTDAQGVAALRQGLDRILETFKGGKTYYDKALDAALATFEAADLPGDRVILFMSDGKPTEIEPSLAAAARAGARGVVLHTFGLGPDFRGKVPGRIAVPPSPTDGVGILATMAALGESPGKVMPLPKPAMVVQIVPQLPILELAEAKLQEVRVVNKTTGEPARRVDLSHDGSFQALVPVSLYPKGLHGSNVLTATAVADDGISSATDSVTVRTEQAEQADEIASFRKELLVARRRIQSLQEENTGLADRHQTLAATCKGKDALVEQLKQSHERQMVELRQAAARESRELRDQIAMLQQERSELQQENSTLTAEVAILEGELRQARRDNQALTRRLREDETKAGALIEKLEAELSALRRRHDQLEGRLRAGTAETGSLRQSLARAQGRIDVLTADVAADRVQSAGLSKALSECRIRPGSLGVTVVASQGRTPSRLLPEVELIIDASNSMWGQIEGRAKITIAKEAMVQVIEDLPGDIKVALRAYGHRIQFRDPGACEDSQLLFPFGRIDKPVLVERIRGLVAKGKTPIAYSLRQFANDVRGHPGNKVIVLVTDGKEECQGDPLAAVLELRKQGIEVIVHVVGFALRDEATKRLLRRLAESTGGSYSDARNAEALGRALRRSLSVGYDVIDDGGRRVASGTVGHGVVEVPPGNYTVIVQTTEGSLTIEPVRITANRGTRIELRETEQGLGFRIQAP